MENSKKGYLILEDGSCYEGSSFGADVCTSGELVFQTGMVGYPESLTDPSFKGQLLILTYPLIGNYGVPPMTTDKYGIPSFFESNGIHVSALLVGEYCSQPSHWNSIKTLQQWLIENKIPALTGLDTRSLVQKVRDNGAILGKIVIGDKKQEVALRNPNQENLVAFVSTKEVKIYSCGENNAKTIIAIDCGMKNNQLRCLLDRKVNVKVVPYNYDFSQDKADFDGVFVSNGPGDPLFCKETITQLQQLMKKDKPLPIFGICLGHQLLALAAGCKTYKMKFGHRSHNQPCMDRTAPYSRCYLTSQNHGFAVDQATIPNDWEIFFDNANDQTNEGIIHKTKPFFSVQFHPEACAGPDDTEALFDKFVSLVRGIEYKVPKFSPTNYPKPKKVLLLGSGGLSIGQAGEFDYSGSQAIKALKEEGIEIILVNPNIATVQTNTNLADRVYFLPVNVEYVSKIIEKEKPDGIMITFGGQTALNCGIELHRAGVLQKNGARILGTPVESIVATEDRQQFAQKMDEINEPIAKSYSVKSLEEAIEAVEGKNGIGYPVIVRAGFALGGLGSGFANNRDDLSKLCQSALTISEFILVEKSMKGWKEIEYEVVRDIFDNCITVANMENFDPVGIHTGESIVVCPSQTLTNEEYFKLRRCALKVIRHLGIVGECNIQYAMEPSTGKYCIIEVNARLSRSSALASKATGYPLAFVAAKLLLGHPLPELRNQVTKMTSAFFEPSLDYLVVKMPLWDLKKFEKISPKIGTSMKSVGEVMSIGRNFEEAFQKAIRMIFSSIDGFETSIMDYSEEELENPTDMRIFAIAAGLKKGITVDRIHDLTKIDKWFLNKLKNIINLENSMSKQTLANLTSLSLLELKKAGFSDKQIAKGVGSTEIAVRELRKELKITPFIKQIDTVAAESAAKNNYLYVTYHGDCNDIVIEDNGVIVLGSGAYRIGSSVEFDWCAVGCITTLQKMGIKTVMINYNPETVSTDYDVCDRLYFEELTLERVLDIYEFEVAKGVIVNMGGQIPNNLALKLWRQSIPILGTNPEMIDSAENRYKFSRLCDSIGVDQPKWKELTNKAEIGTFCDEVGYPVLVRPSYVLSGAAMRVVFSGKDLDMYLSEAVKISREYPVVVSKFIEFAKEIEVDAIAKDGEIYCLCISEHVENAGVHSGDATLVFPAQDLDKETIKKIDMAARQIAKALYVSGPVNMQFLAKDNQIKVIECNLRASRSFPFVSKTLKYNLIEMATYAIMGSQLKMNPVDPAALDYVGVKVAQFSFSRLRGVDPILRVEMSSTGEVACFGADRYEAFLKALISTGFRLPKDKIFISVGSYKEKLEFLPYAKILHELGFQLFGSRGTADFISNHDIPIQQLSWPGDENQDQEADELDVSEFLTKDKIHLCIICPSQLASRRPASLLSRGYAIRRKALENNIPLITNIKFAKFLVSALQLLKKKGSFLLETHDFRTSRTFVKLPGLIDVHVHVREPGQEHKEDWDTCTSAALSGGITLIGAMPNTIPSIVDENALQLVHKVAASKARCDYAIYCGASAFNAPDLPLLAKNTAALKMYLDHTFTVLKLDSMATWLEHFKNWTSEKPILCHSEGSHVPAVILLGKLYGKRVHICHVSRKDEIEVIKLAKQSGYQVTCEVAPHHLFLNQKDTEAILGVTKTQVRPCLTTEEDRKALWDNMKFIDVIATDHAPHTIQEKESTNAPPGFPGLETCLPLLLTAVHDGLLTLDDIIEKMHINPKKIFGFPDQPDTFIEVDMEHAWKIPAQPPFSKAKWTPFAGRRVYGKVARVVLRGETVFQDGVVLAEPGYGKDILTSTSPKNITNVSKEIKLTPIKSHPSAEKIEDRAALSSPIGIAIPHKLESNNNNIVVVSPSKAPLKLPLQVTTHLNVEKLEKDFSGRHILSVNQFSRDDLKLLFDTAREMKFLVRKRGTISLLKGKILATLFYEPSTRTSLSFVAAMQRLGGTVIQCHENISSIQKGETLQDTVRTLENYADVIVLRHPEKGSAQQAAKVCHKPVINAGDGVGEHPTQALLDVFTIREELGTVNGLNIAFVGDLKHGRTVHSLVQLLSHYHVNCLYYVSPASLKIPEEIVSSLTQKGIKQVQLESLDSIIGELNVLYVTRIQKERFANLVEFEKVKDSFYIGPKLLQKAKDSMIVMHPLPRNQELDPAVDSDPRAAYFREMENGMFVRMALLALILGKN